MWTTYKEKIKNLSQRIVDAQKPIRRNFVERLHQHLFLETAAQIAHCRIGFFQRLGSEKTGLVLDVSGRQRVAEESSRFRQALVGG